MFKATKIITIISLIVIPSLTAAFQVGQQQSIKYSRHNLMSLNKIEPIGGSGDGPMEGYTYDNFGEICVYCHTPHNSNPNREAPLWNRQTPLNNYSAYRSVTLDATPRQPSGVSLACLSCHDGTIAVDSVLNKPKIVDQSANGWHYSMARTNGGTQSCGACHGTSGVTNHTKRYLTTDLRDDHPVSIDYASAYAAQSPSEFADPATIAPLRLFNGRVECASCHDVHKPTNPFTYIYPKKNLSDPDVITSRSFHLRKTNGTSSLCLTCHVK